jgi:hypothetical protein
LIEELNEMRREYIAGGGSDPAVLRQMEEMRQQALALEESKMVTRPAGAAPGAPLAYSTPIQPQLSFGLHPAIPAGNGVLQDPALMQMHLENQRLAQEISGLTPGAGRSFSLLSQREERLM